MTDEKLEEVRYASIEDITRKRVSEGEDYDLPGVGTLRIRGLSRAEFLAAQERFPDNTTKQERYVLSRAVIQPKITEEIAGKWQAASGISEINELANRINAISGIGKGADKSGVDQVRD